MLKNRNYKVILKFLIKCYSYLCKKFFEEIRNIRKVFLYNKGYR